MDPAERKAIKALEDEARRAAAPAAVPGAPKARRPFKARGWERRPSLTGLDAEAWQRRSLCVLSSLATMEAPDGSGDVLPTWLVSVSRVGQSMVSDQDLRRVRRDFNMRQAEEDNHQDGIARALFFVVDPARRVDCECKTTERVVERPDGYRYTVPVEPTYESVSKELCLSVEEVVEQLAREKQAAEQIADRLGLCPLPPRSPLGDA